MILQTNSYIVPKEKRAEHARLLSRFRQSLAKHGCDHFEVYEQVGANWAPSENGRFVHIMRFRDRRHQQQVQAAERNDPAAQALIKEFCELINFPYQQQHGMFIVGFYNSVLAVAPSRVPTGMDNEQSGEPQPQSSQPPQSSSASPPPIPVVPVIPVELPRIDPAPESFQAPRDVHQERSQPMVPPPQLWQEAEVEEPPVLDERPASYSHLEEPDLSPRHLDTTGAEEAPPLEPPIVEEPRLEATRFEEAPPEASHGDAHSAEPAAESDWHSADDRRPIEPAREHRFEPELEQSFNETHNADEPPAAPSEHASRFEPEPDERGFTQTNTADEPPPLELPGGNGQSHAGGNGEDGSINNQEPVTLRPEDELDLSATHDDEADGQPDDHLL